MKYVIHDGTHFRCVLLAPDMRTNRPLGCRHEKPAQAKAHTVPVFVDPLRPSGDRSPASSSSVDLSPESPRDRDGWPA